jgi:hypothetical protein
VRAAPSFSGVLKAQGIMICLFGVVAAKARESWDPSPQAILVTRAVAPTSTTSNIGGHKPRLGFPAA